MKSYNLMKQNGIKIKIHSENDLIYKPYGFWVSMNHDWERWCKGENFGDIDNSIICDVKLKPNMKLLKITNTDDADKLIKILIPTIQKVKFRGWKPLLSDYTNIMHFTINEVSQGRISHADKVWGPITREYDGVYYENSATLHFNTFFNSWDCDSMVLFYPDCITLSNPRGI